MAILQPWQRRKSTVTASCILLFMLFLGMFYFKCTPWGFVEKGAKYIGVGILSLYYNEDTFNANTIRASYLIGDAEILNQAPEVLWQEFKRKNPHVTFDLKGAVQGFEEPLFIYEKINASQLKKLRAAYNLTSITSSPSEYESMLKLGAWVGTRWDHGQDHVPGGNISTLDVTDVIKAGENGQKYWCDIAARVMVQAATALGWPSRLVSASKDGYTYDHAVAELWSNEFSKWFVIDTDFNVVFETDGTPLSAFELCHDGPALQKSGKLKILHIARDKPNLKYTDLIPYFAYVHIDLRNDWFTRRLPRGSPEGSDLATYYTTRNSVGPLLTKKKRVDDKARFDWEVNTTYIVPKNLTLVGESGYQLSVQLTGYSPYFKSFAINYGNGTWITITGSEYTVVVADNKEHFLAARMQTEKGWYGPYTKVNFKID